MIALREGASRGQPVVAMLAVLVVWISLRLMFWQSPLLLAQVHRGWALSGATARVAGEMSAPGSTWQEADFHPLVRIELRRLNDGRLHDWPMENGTRPEDFSVMPELLYPLSLSPDRLSEPQRRNGHGLAIASERPMADPVFAPVATAPSRWTMSSWLFWREETAGGRQAATTPNYGRSQGGVVLAYWLAPDSAHRPQVYSRVITPLEGQRDVDLALGLSARPLPDVPVRFAGEARLSLRDGAHELRPAAYAVTEFPPLPLPAKFVGEAYAQGGWVGGDFATGFVDAQLRATRQVAANRAFSLFAGGGAWAGAQKGTRRIDVGPSVGVSFRVGDDVYGRLSADYRLRVAGNAAPASGPALTLSAGF